MTYTLVDNGNPVRVYRTRDQATRAVAAAVTRGRSADDFEVLDKSDFG